jgi:hypothetical protein
MLTHPKDRATNNSLKPALGTFLSKETRNKLTTLCLQSISKTKQPKPLGNIIRQGRPEGPEAVLAEMIGVRQKTVHRWVDPSQIQATDSNTEKLAEIAYKYSPVETAKLLRSEVHAYTLTVDLWLDIMANGG